MICDVCDKEIGPKGFAILVKPEPIKGCEECMQIVAELVKEPEGRCTEVRGIPVNRITESERAPEEQENFNKILNSMHERGRQALKGEE